MTKIIPKKVRFSSALPTVIDNPTTSSHGEEYILSPSPRREVGMGFNMSNPIVLAEDSAASPSSIETEDDEILTPPSTPMNSLCSNSAPLPYTPEGATAIPIVITDHDFVDVPAPPVHLFRYICKVCNILIFKPELVAGHLLQHKDPESQNWTCTSCGKQYLQGRWGYGMLLMHLQGRGGSACVELVDLRAQYAYMLGLEGSLLDYRG